MARKWDVNHQDFCSSSLGRYTSRFSLRGSDVVDMGSASTASSGDGFHSFLLAAAYGKPTESLDAYALYYAVWAGFISLPAGKRMTRRCNCSTSAIELDPDLQQPLATSIPRAMAGFQSHRTRLPKRRGSLTGRLSWAKDDAIALAASGFA
jgi:hypothetical protein